MASLVKVFLAGTATAIVGAGVANKESIKTSPTFKMFQRKVEKLTTAVEGPNHSDDGFYPIYGKHDAGLSEEALNKLRVHPDGKGGVCQRRGPDMKPIPLPPGTHKYVAIRDPDTKKLALYVDTPPPGAKGLGKFTLFDPERPTHHSQFFGGKVPVDCAGEAEVMHEKQESLSQINLLNNDSGHFQPPFSAVVSMVPELQEQGLLPHKDVTIQDQTTKAAIRGQFMKKVETGDPSD